VTTTQRTRLAALRDPVTILRALENKQLPMDATEYLTAAARVSAVLRAMNIVELVVISRSMMAVLSQLADNVLIERGADHLAGETDTRTRARAAAAALLSRF
jgi:hypothetical protein